jgi:hypothetical protein
VVVFAAVLFEEPIESVWVGRIQGKCFVGETRGFGVFPEALMELGKGHEGFRVLGVLLLKDGDKLFHQIGVSIRDGLRNLAGEEVEAAAVVVYEPAKKLLVIQNQRGVFEMFVKDKEPFTEGGGGLVADGGLDLGAEGGGGGGPALGEGTAFIPREVGEGGGDVMNLRNAGNFGFANGLRDGGDAGNVLFVKAEKHDNEVGQMKGADAADVGEAGAGVYEDIVRLAVASDGGFPVLDKEVTVMVLVEVRPVEIGAGGVVGGVFSAGGHDPQFSAEGAWQFAWVEEVGDFRGAFDFFIIRDVFDDSRLASDTFEFVKAVKAGGFEVEINKGDTAAALDE